MNKSIIGTIIFLVATSQLPAQPAGKPVDHIGEIVFQRQPNIHIQQSGKKPDQNPPLGGAPILRSYIVKEDNGDTLLVQAIGTGNEYLVNSQDFITLKNAVAYYTA